MNRLAIVEVRSAALGAWYMAPSFSALSLPFDIFQLWSLKLSDPFCSVYDIDGTLTICPNTPQDFDFHVALYSTPSTP